MAQEKRDSGLDQAAEQAAAVSDSDGSVKSAGGIFGIVLPTDLDVWNEARRLVTDRNLRVDDLATCASQDPVVVMELLRISNAMFFSGGKSAITTTRTAIVRLGSDVVVDMLEKLHERPRIENEDVAHWFEVHRSRCKRTAIIARILAEALARTLADDCQSAGLLMFIGEMVAVAHFKEQYVKLAEELSRSGIIYRLAQEHKFDCESVGLSYLRRYGIPEAVVSAIDREGGRARSQDRAIMKPLCMAASEMVDHFDSNRWEKLAPGKNLPPKSPLRLLQIGEGQYLKIYERCSEYLFSARLLEERKKQKAAAPETDEYGSGGLDIGTKIIADENEELDSEIRDLIRSSLIDARQVEEVPAQEKQPEEPELEPEEQDQFRLEALKSAPKTAARRSEKSDPIESVRVPFTQNAKKVVNAVSSIFERARSSEEVLSDVLQMLIDQGGFKKSALIVVSSDRSKAIVVAARGPEIEQRATLDLDDPLSPLAQCFSRIQSFGNRGSKNSPFGSKSYALAPLDVDHDTPVALYADCGNSGSVPFEARRIFRTVVDLLNEKLPQIAGGLLVEMQI